MPASGKKGNLLAEEKKADGQNEVSKETEKSIAKPDQKEVKEAVRRLKIEYLQRYGVYVYKCQKCRTWIDYTVQNCECKAKNYYYDPESRLNPEKCRELRNLLLKA